MFNLKKDENYLIKNLPKKYFQSDISLNPFNSLIFILFTSFAFYIFINYGDYSQAFNLYDIAILLIFPFLFIVSFIFVSKWESIIKVSLLTVIILYFIKGLQSFYFSIPLVTGAIMSMIFQIAREWERAIVLRLGKFKKVKGPGLFLLFPFIDSVNKKVDLRIRVTDFAAETTLTKDSVTVTVDALCFWMVWDPEKAVLEVENYMDAVVLSSQTALRAAISRNDLSTLLEDSEHIEDMVRKEVDKKTTEWGITITHIEITDIQIPKELQDSMSRLAQAEREKKSRILLGEAEIELAKKFNEASEYYKNNDIALKLRAMHVLNEGLKAGNSMMMVPSNIMEQLSTKDLFGIQALEEINKIKNKSEEK